MPSSPTTLTFSLPDGTTSAVTVRRLLNAGYAGQDQAEVQAHIDELAALGVPAPSTTPTLFSVSPYLAQQTDRVDVQHATTSGEAEWALVIDDTGRVLLTCACDHTDRLLEAHGVAWSKNASPDVLGSQAWPYADIVDRFDDIVLRGWVGEDREVIQHGRLSALLDVEYWLAELDRLGERRPGTILLSGTIPMIEGRDQFSRRWGVSLEDAEFGTISLEYSVAVMPDPID